MAESSHAAVETVLVLLLVVFAVAVVVQRVRLPYTIALVLTGLLGFQPGFRHIQLTPDLILTVFLPVLLFEGAYNVPVRNLWADVVPVTLLAVPGVLLCSIITAAGVRYLLELPWDVALLFGALISSTDPIAVVSLFKELRAPKRLALLVEGESLFNDGAAITLFQIILAMTLTDQVRILDGVGTFLLTVAGALSVGGLIGYAGSRLIRAVDDAQIQITATVIAAYGSFLLSEYWGFSGAIAVVVTALFFGNYGSIYGISSRSVRALGTTWEFLGFVANSLIFLLIGIELVPKTLLTSWELIGIAFLASLFGRAVVVGLLTPLLQGRLRIPRPFRLVLVWGGLRGAVSLALVLSLPLTLPGGQPFPERAQLQVMAFGVVGVSLILQGLTMGPLLRRLRLSTSVQTDVQQGALQARLLAVEGALQALGDAKDRGVVSGLGYTRLARAYQHEHDQINAQLRDEE